VLSAGCLSSGPGGLAGRLLGSRGNKDARRILPSVSMSMTRLSSPIPAPACGGAPGWNASMYSSILSKSIFCASIFPSTPSSHGFAGHPSKSLDHARRYQTSSSLCRHGDRAWCRMVLLMSGTCQVYNSRSCTFPLPTRPAGFHPSCASLLAPMAAPHHHRSIQNLVKSELPLQMVSSVSPSTIQDYHVGSVA